MSRFYSTRAKRSAGADQKQALSPEPEVLTQLTRS